jgi:hypothetical protein
VAKDDGCCRRATGARELHLRYRADKEFEEETAFTTDRWLLLDEMDGIKEDTPPLVVTSPSGASALDSAAARCRTHRIVLTHKYLLSSRLLSECLASMSLNGVNTSVEIHLCPGISQAVDLDTR